MKKCLGCEKEYSNDVWLHEELGLCSICYSIHIHSKVKRWDKKYKRWVGLRCKDCDLTICNNNYDNCPFYYECKKCGFILELRKGEKPPKDMLCGLCREAFKGKQQNKLDKWLE